MKSFLKILLASAAFGASSLLLQAQPAPKILIVDMGKLFDSHYKTEEHRTKLQGDERRAHEEIEKLNREGKTLMDQYQDIVEQSKNPALTTEARGKAETDAQRKLEEIQAKHNEVRQFQMTAQRTLGERLNSFRELLIEEISTIAVNIAKKKGATILLDKAGPTSIGISNILYSDAAYEITDEVAAEIAKTRPATPAAAPATSGAKAPAASDSTVTFPGAKKN